VEPKEYKSRAAVLARKIASQVRAPSSDSTAYFFALAIAWGGEDGARSFFGSQVNAYGDEWLQDFKNGEGPIHCMS
jgi:hypothetical protein